MRKYPRLRTSWSYPSSSAVRTESVLGPESCYSMPPLSSLGKCTNKGGNDEEEHDLARQKAG